jgi:hypothetical protein
MNSAIGTSTKMHLFPFKHAVGLISALLSLVFPCNAAEILDPEGDILPTQLVYRATIRDFIPAICFGLTSSLRDQWFNVWGLVPGQTINYAQASQCPFRTRIQSGDLVPHMDFQAANYQQGFPGNQAESIIFRGNGRGAISSIAGKGLAAVDSSGVPKVSYCTTNTTDFCGKTLTGSVRVPVTSGLDNFKLWYTDDRRTNRRNGAKLILSDADGDGTFNYNSGAFFDPLTHIPHVTPDETDPDNSLRWDKRKIVAAIECGPTCVAAANKPFFLTTELHTFFQYRGGEVFR